MNMPSLPRSLMLLSLTLAACSTTSDVMDVTGASATRESTTILEIENNNLTDIAVYVGQWGTPTYLGKVKTMGRRSFRIPAPFLERGGSMRVEIVELDTGERFLTAPIPASPGQRIQLNVKNHIQLSAYEVSRIRG